MSGMWRGYWWRVYDRGGAGGGRWRAALERDMRVCQCGIFAEGLGKALGGVGQDMLPAGNHPASHDQIERANQHTQLQTCILVFNKRYHEQSQQYSQQTAAMYICA